MRQDLLLALETSTRAGSAALLRDGDVLSVRAVDDGLRHTAGLLPAVQTLLVDCGATAKDLTLIAFSEGPGSFTGLRVGATVVRMLQAVTHARAVAVPTMAVIADNARTAPPGPQYFAPIVDARRGQVFGALFERRADGTVCEIAPVAVRDPETWLAHAPRPLGVLGPGAEACRSAITSDDIVVLAAEFWQPRAEAVARLGWALAQAGVFCEAADIRPHYIRPPECEEVYEQRRAAAIAKRQGPGAAS